MPVRMMLFAAVDAVRGHEFEAAFQVVRQRVATIPGHVRDELLRKDDEPGSYVLVSDWRSRDEFLGWLRSSTHDEMTAEMRPYFLRPSEMRFYSLLGPDGA